MSEIRPQFDQKKFRELVLYIAKGSEDDPRFGAVKLNKILYYSDFNAYRRLRQSITGATYQKLNEGPAPREMLATRKLMVDVGEIIIVQRPYFDGVQQRIIALRNPDTNVFGPEELAIVDETIAEMWHMSARQASDYSHTELGWIAARSGEDIPYETAWLSPDPIPQEAEEYWSRVKSKFG